jgi:hypothetical protein
MGTTVIRIGELMLALGVGGAEVAAAAVAAAARGLVKRRVAGGL